MFVAAGIFRPADSGRTEYVLVVSYGPRCECPLGNLRPHVAGGDRARGCAARRGGVGPVVAGRARADHRAWGRSDRGHDRAVAAEAADEADTAASRMDTTASQDHGGQADPGPSFGRGAERRCRATARFARRGRTPTASAAATTGRDGHGGSQLTVSRAAAGSADP